MQRVTTKCQPKWTSIKVNTRIFLFHNSLHFWYDLVLDFILCSISTQSIVVGLWIRFASLTKRMLVVRFVRDCHSYPPEHVIKIKSSSLTKNQFGVQISRWELNETTSKTCYISCIAKVSHGFELSLILQCFVVF